MNDCKKEIYFVIEKTVCEAVSYLNMHALCVSGRTNADLNVPVRLFQRFNRQIIL